MDAEGLKGGLAACRWKEEDDRWDHLKEELSIGSTRAEESVAGTTGEEERRLDRRVRAGLSLELAAREEEHEGSVRVYRINNKNDLKLTKKKSVDWIDTRRRLDRRAEGCRWDDNG